MIRDHLRGRPALRHRLAIRFGLILCLGLAALFLLLGWWNVTTQRTHMVNLTGQAAARCSSLIRSATRDGMLHDDPDRVARLIEQIAGSESVRRVRILDRDGVVRHASGPGPDEDRLPIDAYQCQVCHGLDPVPSALEHQRRMREFESEGGEALLNVVEPIPNEPACSTADCHAHPGDRRILGIIDIDLHLTEMNRLLEESETQLGLGLLVTMGLLLVLGFALTWRMVLGPVAEIAAATEKVAAGDLEARVPVHSSTEIGRMAVAWNSMVEQLAKARGELEEWSRTLEERVEAKTAEVEGAHERMLVVEKMAALGKLAAVVAHEINNPLAGIATYSKLLHKKFGRMKEEAEQAGEELPGCLDPDTLKALDLVQSEATRCGTIVRNLLMFSRTPGARFAEVDLGGLLERCAMLVHHKAELQEVDIQIQVDEDVPKITCDASQIQQVLLALTMNAVEAMPAGGTLKLHLSKAEDRDGDGVLLEVIDTGCGIPAEALPHVFEPFFTTKLEGEGVGLGLSVVYGIVERHHGGVTAYSVPGEGTTFRVYLPCTQPETPAETPPEDSTREGGVS